MKQSATLKLIERSKAEWHFKTITIERSEAEWDRPSQSQSAADLVNFKGIVPLGGLPPKARKPLFRSLSVCQSDSNICIHLYYLLSPSQFHLELSTDRQYDSNVHGIVDGQNLLYIRYIRYFSYVEFFLTHGLRSTIHTYTGKYTEKKRDLNVGPPWEGIWPECNAYPNPPWA